MINKELGIEKALLEDNLPDEALRAIPQHLGVAMVADRAEVALTNHGDGKKPNQKALFNGTAYLNSAIRNYEFLQSNTMAGYNTTGLINHRLACKVFNLDKLGESEKEKLEQLRTTIIRLYKKEDINREDTQEAIYFFHTLAEICLEEEGRYYSEGISSKYTSVA